jgi:hypothetical protein
MTRTSTLRFSLAAALGATAMIAAASASAQTPTTSSSAGVLTTATPTATTSVKRKPTSATPDMINEAIQRSEARAAREAQSGTPQKWGSEEPFVYNPTVKQFDKSMQ